MIWDTRYYVTNQESNENKFPGDSWVAILKKKISLNRNVKTELQGDILQEIEEGKEEDTTRSAEYSEQGIYFLVTSNTRNRKSHKKRGKQVN